MKRYIKQIYQDGSNLLGEVLSEELDCINTRVFMSCGKRIPPLTMKLFKGNKNRSTDLIEFSEEELMLEIL